MFLNTAVLLAFIPTFFFVSITPGMCMTLSMSLGMTVGVRRTLWMMIGELAGVALVATSAVVGIAAVMLNFPLLFMAFKIVGGLYLAYLGVQLWRSKGKLALAAMGEQQRQISRKDLVWQGFMTAIANPKGWAFFIALLPPFIDPAISMVSQLPALIAIILLLEFVCLVIYASGGKSLALLLKNQSNVKLINRCAGTLMLGVGGWLIAS
ncbi:LysE family translocator [Oceanobacter mangrovi]|uniref:LysE family translocator n=1 Tax=Oceanobacter mangrovi TaxID=2862510 RepID=UPI001C8DE373|nr:LysE family translocator [Oceanobacter mangrovi]